jgi:Glucodextranase, domain B
LRGTVQAPPNASVFVNGMLATVAADGTFFVNNVQLEPGSNTITIEVRTQEGQTSTTTYTLNGNGTSPFTFIVEPPAGPAPLQSRLLVVPSAQTVFTRIDYRCSDIGNVISTSTLNPITCSYSQPGSYTAHADVILVDGGGVEQVIFAGTQVVEVTQWQSLDSTLRAVYFGMLAKLRAGNIDGALTAITPDMRATYREVFEGIPNVPAAVDELGTIGDVTINRRYARYVILRPSADGNGYDGYDVYFVRGADGIWRIDSM